MIYSIDGIRAPQLSGAIYHKTTMWQIPLARFILDNLKPDSDIGYFDFEGFSTAPTYDSLMAYARMILPNYVPPQRYRGTLEMRQACAKLCNRVLETQARYITPAMYEEIKAAWEKKREASSMRVLDLLKRGKHMIFDSIPEYDFKLEHA